MRVTMLFAVILLTIEPALAQSTETCRGDVKPPIEQHLNARQYMIKTGLIGNWFAPNFLREAGNDVDYQLLHNSGMVRLYIVNKPTTREQMVEPTAILKDPSFVSFYRGGIWNGWSHDGVNVLMGRYTVTKIARTEAVTVGVNHYCVAYVLYDYVSSPMMQAVPSRGAPKQKGRFLLKDDPFADQRIFVAADYADADALDFSTDRVGAAIVTMR